MRRLRRAIAVLATLSLAFGGFASACNSTYQSSYDAGGPQLDASSAIDATTNANDGSANDGSTGDGSASDGGSIDAADEVLTFLSPSDPSGTLVLPISIDWTIASDPPTAIRYSTNGTLADAAVGASPVVIATPEAGAIITWQVVGDPVAHSFLVQIDTGMQQIATSATYDFLFTKSSSPIVHATPAEVLGVTVGTAIEWNEPQAPTAIDQITIGYTDASVACIVDSEPGVYPGHTTSNAMLNITAPTTAGTYFVQLGFQREFKCTPNAIDTPLTGPIIGIMIVD